MSVLWPLVGASLFFSAATIGSASFMLWVLATGSAIDEVGLQPIWLVGSLMSGLATLWLPVWVGFHPALPTAIHPSHRLFPWLVGGVWLAGGVVSAVNNLALFSSPWVGAPLTLAVVGAGPVWALWTARRLNLVPTDEARLGLGQWDLLQLSTLLQAAQWRVGAIRYHTPDGRRVAGAGVLIAADLLLTAWHVVRPAVDHGLDPEDVFVGFAAGPSGDGAVQAHLAPSWRVFPAEDPDDDAPDLAVVRLARAIGDEALPDRAAVVTRGWFRLRSAPRMASDTPLVNVKLPDQRALAAFGQVVRHDGSFLVYRLDTAPGDSGSPCFSGRHLVAVHKGAFPEEDANRGTLVDASDLATLGEGPT